MIPAVRLPSLLHTIEAVVIMIAVGSFLISYNNLHQSALLAGIPALLAWVFPLTVDAFLVCCSGFILYACQKGVSGREGWAFLILYTVASIAFNVHMAPPDIWSQLGFAMCPIGLCVALHFLMMILDIEARAVIPSPALPGPVEEQPEPVLTDEQTAVLEYYRVSPRAKYSEAGRELNMNPRHVKLHLDAVTGMGLL